MRPLLNTIFAVASCLWALAEAPAEATVSWQRGDDMAWARPEFDDADWNQCALSAVPADIKSLWIRFPVRLAPEQQQLNNLAIVFVGLGSCEVYWDGHRLGSSGTVGNDSDHEVPGRIRSEHYIPNNLRTDARHTVAIRLSAHHRGFLATTAFYSATVEDADQRGWTRETVAVLTLGAFVLASTYFCCLFFSALGRTAHLVLATLAVVTAAMLLCEVWRHFVVYTYDWHVVRLRAIWVLALASGLLVNLYLLFQFDLPRFWKWLVGAVTLACLLALYFPGYDRKTLIVLQLLYGSAMALVVHAVYGRQRGSGYAFIGIASLVGILFAFPHQYLSIGGYLAMTAMFITLMISQVSFAAHQEQMRVEASLQAERLRTELLQQHMQPHFLMNTLTALQEWTESDPAKGAQMIQRLGEFYAGLYDTVNRSLIRVSDELNICANYLKVIGFRKDIEFQLSATGVLASDRIPPGVVLTLLENAITHNQYSAEAIEFSFAAESLRVGRRFKFTCPLQERSESGNSVDRSQRQGMGTRFINTKLQEAFGSAFQFDSWRRADHWTTVVVVPNRRRAESIHSEIVSS